MPKISSDSFRDILKNDGFLYTIKSTGSEPIDRNFPNLPDWHKEDFDEWRREMLPDSTVILFEYKGSNYKLLRNMGDADCNDGTFGALFDDNNEKILDLLSTGDMETTIKSLKSDDNKISEYLSKILPQYLQFFEVVLDNNTELEYLVFKILVENDFFYDIDDIDDRYDDDNDDDDDDDDNDDDEDDGEN